MCVNTFFKYFCTGGKCAKIVYKNGTITTGVNIPRVVCLPPSPFYGTFGPVLFVPCMVQKEPSPCYIKKVSRDIRHSLDTNNNSNMFNPFPLNNPLRTDYIRIDFPSIS